ncbi:MAG TPA: efflux RND transporter periplasmic adaptor subunit [Nitrospiria bacterium]|nr:efflux RND transporter periplasmic adaptor subunit [Nitrospiria bacterium]
MKKYIFAGIILVLLLFIAYMYFGKGQKPTEYRMEKLNRGDIVASVTATGTVNAVVTVLVGTQVSGTIKNLFVDFNSPVRKGQLIALIDPMIFETQVDQAKANLLSAKANLEKAEASLIDTKRTFERNQDLFSKNLIAKADMDTAETNYLSAKAQMSGSQASIVQAEASLKYSQTNLMYTRIVSPVDGTVVSRNVDIGQTVAASFQTPTLFNIAQDLTKMQIDSSISEADIGKIAVGQQVEFTVDAYPDTIFKGLVSEIRNAPIMVQNVVTYDVVIKVDNRELKLKPGMTANVSIVLSRKKDVLRVSNAALRFTPTGSKNVPGVQSKTRVWILEDQNPRSVPIVPGITDGNYTEIVSGELKESQQVIVEAVKPGRSTGPTGPRMF